MLSVPPARQQRAVFGFPRHCAFCNAKTVDQAARRHVYACRAYWRWGYPTWALIPGPKCHLTKPAVQQHIEVA